MLGQGAASGRGRALDQPGLHAAVGQLHRPEPGPAPDLFDRRTQHSLDGDVVRVSGQALAQGGLERGQRELVDAHRPRERVARHLPDRLLASEDDPRLWSPEQLVARERDHVAVLDGFRDGWFVANRLRGAAAEIVEQQEAVPAGDAGQVGERGRFGEAGDTEVRSVNPQQRGGAWRDRLLVVGGAGSVRGSDLHHACAGQPHHVWHPKRPADLDELAPRDDDLPALAQRAQGEQDGGRVVVDDECGLASEKRGQQAPDQAGTFAALARLEVELEVAVAGREPEGVHRRLRERRAAEVGVEDDAARVDDAAQPRRDAGAEPRQDGVVPGRGFSAPLAFGGDLGPNRLDHPLAPVLLDELGVVRLVDERAYSRQGNRVLRYGTPYGMHVPVEIRLAGWKKGDMTKLSRFTRLKNSNRMRMRTRPAQISRCLTWTSKKKRA